MNLLRVLAGDSLNTTESKMAIREQQVRCCCCGNVKCHWISKLCFWLSLITLLTIGVIALATCSAPESDVTSESTNQESATYVYNVSDVTRGAADEVVLTTEVMKGKEMNSGGKCRWFRTKLGENAHLYILGK